MRHFRHQSTALLHTERTVAGIMVLKAEKIEGKPVDWICRQFFFDSSLQFIGAFGMLVSEVIPPFYGVVLLVGVHPVDVIIVEGGIVHEPGDSFLEGEQFLYAVRIPARKVP